MQVGTKKKILEKKKAEGMPIVKPKPVPGVNTLTRKPVSASSSSQGADAAVGPPTSTSLAYEMQRKSDVQCS